MTQDVEFHIEGVPLPVKHALQAGTGVVVGRAPEPVRQVDHARALGRAMRRPSFMPAPAFAIRAATGDFAVELLASRRVVPARALATGYAFRYPELGPALASVFAR